MVVRSLDVEKDPFRPRDDGEEVLGPEVPYLSAVGALMYLANCTRPDIAFAVNLLARHSAAPTKRHWSGVKNIFRYLQGTKDLGLFFQFQKNQDSDVIGYADAGYLSDPHNARSQTGFVFLHGGTAISWKSLKQTLVATSTNHSEIISLFEATCECMQTGYIKSNITKHISPKWFFPHNLQKSGEISILQVKSCDNLADLFTKSLPHSTFQKCVHGIGSHQRFYEELLKENILR
ncbi:hypothetical protein ACQJBY_039939 [Aegilops geniculata]